MNPIQPRTRMWRIVALLGAISVIVGMAVAIMGYFYLRDQRAFAEISEALYAGDDDLVNEKVDHHLQGTSITIETIGTRRVVTQALSTTGRMFGFERPTNPECPLAYPESLREFQLKRVRLCIEEEDQRDLLLRRWGGTPSPMGKTRATVISRVSQKYFVE